MKIFRLEKSINLPITIEECWEFFSNPKNLKIITPNYMGFDIIDLEDTKMYSGQIIKYNVTPLLGIKMRWVTEISHVKENSFFVDEQRFGPYKFWHHKHKFEIIDGGVKIVDIRIGRTDLTEQVSNNVYQRMRSEREKEANLLRAEGEELSKEIAKSNAFSLAGGGETLSAINKYIKSDDVSYCSTGGGAFLEFMEGKVLPSIKALNSKK